MFVGWRSCWISGCGHRSSGFLQQLRGMILMRAQQEGATILFLVTCLSRFLWLWRSLLSALLLKGGDHPVVGFSDWTCTFRSMIAKCFLSWLDLKLQKTFKRNEINLIKHIESHTHTHLVTWWIGWTFRPHQFKAKVSVPMWRRKCQVSVCWDTKILIWAVSFNVICFNLSF